MYTAPRRAARSRYAHAPTAQGLLAPHQPLYNDSVTTALSPRLDIDCGLLTHARGHRTHWCCWLIKGGLHSGHTPLPAYPGRQGILPLKGAWLGISEYPAGEKGSFQGTPSPTARFGCFMFSDGGEVITFHEPGFLSFDILKVRRVDQLSRSRGCCPLTAILLFPTHFSLAEILVLAGTTGAMAPLVE